MVKRFWQYMAATKYCIGMVLLLSMASCTRVEVGAVVKEDGVKCMIAAVDEENRPTLLLSVEELTHITYDSAIRWAATIGESGQWNIPTREQLQLLLDNRDVLNAKAERRDERPVLQKHSFYWSSTPEGETHVYALGPYGIRPYFVDNTYYKALAVKVLQY